MKLYHGSPKNLKILKPQKAKGMDKFESSKRIFLTKTFKHAALYAIGKTLKRKTAFGVSERKLVILGDSKPKDGFVYEVEVEKPIKGILGQFACEKVLELRKKTKVFAKDYKKNIVRVGRKGEILRKLNRDEAIVILDKYLSSVLVKEEWYKIIKKYVKAIVFYGSTAKGTNSLDSDLDILIFVPLRIEEKYTKGEYFYKYKSREVNIVLRSIERLRKLANGNNKFEAEVFRTAEILVEADSEVRGLIKRICG